MAVPMIARDPVGALPPSHWSRIFSRAKSPRRTMPAPFRADHVGSLLRPKALHEARARQKKGEISAEELKKAEDQHIRDVVKLQQDVGLQSITDGEFRRDWWHIDFLHGFDGVELAAPQYADDAKFKNTEEQPPYMIIEGKI